MKNNNSRTRNSIKNVFSGFLYQCVTLVLTFTSRTIFLQVLSVDYLGINGLFNDILQMLSLADLGFNTAMTYSFYKPLAEDDTKKITQLVNFYKRVYTIIAIGVATVGVILTPFVKYIVNVEKEIPLLHVYYLLSVAGIVVSYLFVYKTTLLIADQKNYLINKISIVVNTVKTIIQIFVLILFKNYVIYLVVALGATFFNNYIASKKVESEYLFLSKNTQSLAVEEKKSIFGNLKAIFLYKISGILINATDNIFISILVDTAAVGYYSNYLIVSSKITGMLSTCFSSVVASVGNIIVTEKEEKRYEVFQTLQTISCIFCGIIVVSYLLLVNDFVSVWLGAEYLFDKSTVFVIALNLYLGCVLQPLWSYREATGLYVKTKYIMMATAILNIILSVQMGKCWGLKGILLASAVSRLLTYIWYEPYLLFKYYFNKQVKEYYLSLISSVCIIIVLVFINGILLRNIVVDGWIKFFIKVVVVVCVTTIEFVIVYAKTDGYKLLRNKIENVFKLIINK